MRKIFTVLLISFNCIGFAQDSFDSPFGRVPEMSQKESDAINEAKSAISANDLPQAIAILKPVADANSDASAINFNLANLYYKQNNFKEAAIYYRNALKSTPSFFMAQKNLGFTLASDGDETSAFENLKKALALSGGADTDILLWLTNYHIKNKDYSSALTLCNQALVYLKDKNDALSAKAFLLFQKGDYADANSLCLEILSKDSKNYEIVKILVKSRAKLGDYAGAVSALQSAKLLGKTDNSILEFEAGLYFKLGLFKKAAELYSQVHSQDGIKYATLAFLNIGDYDSAIKYASLLRNHQSYKLKGLAYYQKQEYQKALDELLVYKKDFPRDNQVLFAIANSYLRIEDYSKANAFFQAVCDDNDYRQASLYAMLNIAIIQNRGKNALDLAKQIQEKYPSQKLSTLIKNLEKK